MLEQKVCGLPCDFECGGTCGLLAGHSIRHHCVDTPGYWSWSGQDPEDAILVWGRLQDPWVKQVAAFTSQGEPGRFERALEADRFRHVLGDLFAADLEGEPLDVPGVKPGPLVPRHSAEMAHALREMGWTEGAWSRTSTCSTCGLGSFDMLPESLVCVWCLDCRECRPDHQACQA